MKLRFIAVLFLLHRNTARDIYWNQEQKKESQCSQCCEFHEKKNIE